MTLIELEAQLLRMPNQEKPTRANRSTLNPWRDGVGVEFSCPQCSQRMRLLFNNPIDGGAPMFGGGYDRTGTALDALSVTQPITHTCGMSGTLAAGELTVGG